MADEEAGPNKGESIRDRIAVLEFKMHAQYGFNAETWGNMVDRLKSLEQAILKQNRGCGSIEARVEALEDAMKHLADKKKSMKVCLPEDACSSQVLAFHHCLLPWQDYSRTERLLAGALNRMRCGCCSVNPNPSVL